MNEHGELDGMRVTVMGLGRFGGGVGVTRWLLSQGATVTVTDKASPDVLRASLEEIADLPVSLRLGGHDKGDFVEADMIVVNPAVPEQSPFLQAARDVGVPITTEINLFVERCPARVVGVTGSVGKSTVTAMLGHILEAAAGGGTSANTGNGDSAPGVPASDGAAPPEIRRAWVGGNIGRSLLDALPEMSVDDVVALELSSFQLERTPVVGWSPHVAVITNVTPNHLDWHGGFEAYREAKLNIVRFQDRSQDVVVLGDAPELTPMAETLRLEGRSVWQCGLAAGDPVAAGCGPAVRWEGLRLAVPGKHNRLNAAAALTAAHALGVAVEQAVAALATFEALPHRLQRVAEHDDVIYYDDSKSTTPESTLTAMAAFEGPLLMILGGYDKGSDLGPLAHSVAQRAKYAACVGATGRGLAEAITAAGGEAAYMGELAAAVAACRSYAEGGDVVLLSPACASWDQFVDYRARGEAFTRLARGDR
jgi:UDP-N-acetylmuramoylalanine--D-glutamate ligase